MAVMATELEQTRDHARRMAVADHAPECYGRAAPWLKLTPRPGCRECVTDADRALWRAIADEIDAHLAAPVLDVDEGLFA